MELIEFVGFLIVLIMMTVIVAKGVWDKRQRRIDPEGARKRDEVREQVFKEFLRNLERGDEEEEEEQPPPAPVKRPPAPPKEMVTKKASKRIVGDQYGFKDRFDDYKTETAVEKRKLLTAIESRSYHPGDVVSPDLKREDAYAIKVQETDVKGSNLISYLKSKKDMVILHEILSKPKGY